MLRLNAIFLAIFAMVILLALAECDDGKKQPPAQPPKKVENKNVNEETAAATELEKTDINECLTFYETAPKAGDYATVEVFIGPDGAVLSSKIKSLSSPNKRFENCLIKTLRFQKVKPTGKIMNIIVGIPLK